MGVGLAIFAAISCNLAALGMSPGWGPALAEDGPRTFEQAVQAYRDGDWTTARTLFTELLAGEETGVDQAAVLYDLGNVAWREGRPLEAAAWYTACIRLSPRHRDAWANLEFVRAEAGIEPADRGDLSSTVRRLVTALTPGEAGWLVLGLSALLFAVLALEAVFGGALFRRLSLGATFLLVVGMVPWAWHLSGGPEHPVFVIAADGAALRSEPTPGATVVGRLAAGSEAGRIDGLPDWVRVEGADGTRGWLESAEVAPLSFPSN